MKAKIDKYIKLLHIELEDIQEDIRTLAELYGEREKKREITHYISLENIALLKKEISSIKEMILSVDAFPAEKFNTLEELVAEIDAFIRKKMSDSDFPEAVYIIIKRKLNKILEYVRAD